MSVKLFEADYISVIWEKVESSYVTADTNSTEMKNIKVDIKFIQLYITIQINWKLKTIDPRFEVIECTKWLLAYELKNWKEWGILYATLRDLGYPIATEGILESEMNSWLQELFN